MIRSPHPTETRLASLTLFDGLSGRERRRLARHVEVIQVRAGKALIREDKPNRFTYLVVSGGLDVMVDGDRVANVGPDELVGERTLFGEPVANATVVAAVDSEVLAIEHRTLLASAEDHPVMADRLRGVDAARTAA